MMMILLSYGSKTKPKPNLALKASGPQNEPGLSYSSGGPHGAAKYWQHFMYSKPAIPISEATAKVQNVLFRMPRNVPWLPATVSKFLQIS